MAQPTSTVGRAQYRCAREPQFDGTSFGDALAALHRGVAVRVVLAMVCGRDSGGRAWLDHWDVLLAALATEQTRRAVVQHWLRLFDGARHHGSQMRVVDARGFVGHQHEFRAGVREVIDPESGEVLEQLEPPRRHHCPKSRAQGLTPREKKSPRQQNRYRRYLRAGRIMRSVQPPANGKGAVVPRVQPSERKGTWAYAQHWLCLPPSAEMRARWGLRPLQTLPTRPIESGEAPETRDEVRDVLERELGPRDPQKAR